MVLYSHFPLPWLDVGLICSKHDILNCNVGCNFYVGKNSMQLSRSLQAADFSILCGRFRTGNRPAFPRFVTDVAETEARMADGDQEQSKSWEEIAAQASTEHDAEKLMKLVRELCERFDQARSPSNRARISQIYAQT